MKQLCQGWQDLSIKIKTSFLLGTGVVIMWLIVAIVLLQLNAFTQKSEVIMNEYQEITGFMEAFSAENVSLENYIRPASPSTASADYLEAIEQTDELLTKLVPNILADQREAFVLEQAIQNAMVYYRLSQNEILQLTDPKEMIDPYLSLKTQAAYIDGYSRQLLDVSIKHGSQEWEEIESANQRVSRQFLMMLVLGTLFLVSVLYLFNRDVLKPLGQLSRAADTISTGCYDAPPIEIQGKNELGRTADSFNLMQSEIRRTIHALEKQAEMEKQLLEKEVEAEQMHRKLQEGRFAQLQSQINPHFLFNTLNTIAAMAREEHAPLSEDLILRLSNFFRYSLGSDEKLVPLGREIQLLRDYMELQETRYGERITMEIQSDPSLEQHMVPKFILQPLVENAIIHGLRECRGGGIIRVRTFRGRDGITILVSDNGCGFDPRQPRVSSGNHLSVGLDNIAERIELAGGRLCIFSRQGLGTSAKILLKEGHT